MIAYKLMPLDFLWMSFDCGCVFSEFGIIGCALMLLDFLGLSFGCGFGFWFSFC